MIRKNSIPTDKKEALNYIDDLTDKLDEHRLSGLQEERNIKLIKDEILQRERKRLEVKHSS